MGVTVGAFEEKLSELKKQRDDARRQLEEFAHGARYKWKGQDITERRKARIKHLLESLDATITAYEDLNAEGS
jgi:hypothetical protein